MPAISILTPVWNGLPYIQECVASVLAQEFSDWELIISDNGSTDATGAYLDTLSDPRIRIFKQPKNLGIFGNLNFLHEQATAPIAFILCADDYFLPGALGTIRDRWQAHGDEPGFLIFNYGFSRIAVHRAGFALRALPARIEPEESALLFFLFGNNAGNLSNVSTRPAAVIGLGGFRQSLPFAGDGEMWARMAGKYPFVVEGTRVSHVRRHPGVASIYLNAKGELIAQQRQVARGLFAQVATHYPTWLLRAHATIIYDALHRDTGLRRLLKGGGGAYLRLVDARDADEKMLLGVGWAWLLFVLTAGGRFGRDLIPLFLLKFCRRQPGMAPGRHPVLNGGREA